MLWSCQHGHSSWKFVLHQRWFLLIFPNIESDVGSRYNSNSASCKGNTWRSTPDGSKFDGIPKWFHTIDKRKINLFDLIWHIHCYYLLCCSSIRVQWATKRLVDAATIVLVQSPFVECNSTLDSWFKHSYSRLLPVVLLVCAEFNFDEEKNGTW